MTPEQNQELFKRFPLLYRNRLGLAVKSGWYPLIFGLSMRLEPLIIKQRFGSNPLDKLKVIVSRLFNYFGLDIEMSYSKSAYVVQVKEKFGGLRFYMDGPLTKEMHELISYAENESFSICEVCGEPGRLRNERQWVITLCNECNFKAMLTPNLKKY